MPARHDPSPVVEGVEERPIILRRGGIRPSQPNRPGSPVPVLQHDNLPDSNDYEDAAIQTPRPQVRSLRHRPTVGSNGRFKNFFPPIDQFYETLAIPQSVGNGFVVPHDINYLGGAYMVRFTGATPSNRFR